MPEADCLLPEAGCHPERSEGSLQFDGDREQEQLRRSFASLRMTAYCLFRFLLCRTQVRIFDLQQLVI